MITGLVLIKQLSGEERQALEGMKRVLEGESDKRRLFLSNAELSVSP